MNQEYHPLQETRITIPETQEQERANNNYFALLFSTDTIAIIVAFIITVISYFTPPFNRDFYGIADINHPHLPDIVPIYVVFIFITIAPIPLCFFKKNFLAFIYRYGFGLVLTLCVTEWLKIVVGRLRPDFLDRCQPVNGVCTGLFKLVNDGRKSFPSGHSSISFYSTHFLILESGLLVSKKAEFIIMLIVVLFYSFPVYTAISR